MKELKIRHSLLNSPDLTRCLLEFSDPVTGALVDVSTQYIASTNGKIGYYSVKFNNDIDANIFKLRNGQFKYL